MIDKARIAAVATLKDIEEQDAYSNIRLNQYFKSYNLEQKDRGFASEILYGTLRNKLKIDHMIGKLSKTPLNKISPWAKSCIRTGIYQIFYMDRVPDFAAVNEAVEIAKAKDKKASAFVNGVLRNVLRNKEEYNNINADNTIDLLSIQYSHPKWFVKKYLPIYGEEFLKRWMEVNNTPSEMCVRVNTLKAASEQLEKLLVDKGVQVAHGIISEALLLRGYGMIEKSPEYNSGLLTIQDQSSMLSSIIMNPVSGDRVLDMCSAPGGKSTHMAQLMADKGEIFSFDLYEHKIKLIRQNAQRLGIHIIKAQAKDALEYDASLQNFADCLLLDAPCSGLGLIRKKPEIRYKINEESIKGLQDVQLKMLNKVCGYVRPGGRIVYSTCTITNEENEEVISSFLRNNSEYYVESVMPFVPETLKESVTDEGYLRLFPQYYDTDGFFIARLRRRQ